MTNDRSKKVTGLVLLLVVLAALTIYAFWMVFMGNKKVPHFGAIAVSQTALDYGTAWGYADSSAAAQRSLVECNKRAANQDCAVQVSLANNCGAMAMSSQTKHAFIVADTDPAHARAVAINECQASGAGDCVLKENFCASSPAN